MAYVVKRNILYLKPLYSYCNFISSWAESSRGVCGDELAKGYAQMGALKGKRMSKSRNPRRVYAIGSTTRVIKQQ
jgi:hypothetical protein